MAFFAAPRRQQWNCDCVPVACARAIKKGVFVFERFPTHGESSYCFLARLQYWCSAPAMRKQERGSGPLLGAIKQTSEKFV